MEKKEGIPANPIGRLAPHIWLVVLLLSSSVAEARSNGVTGYSNNVKACKNMACQNWSPTEKFVWDQTCAGEIADFNEKENKELDPELPCCWSKSRKISSEFLETILFEKPFREVVTRKGVRIIGAYFPDEIDLGNGHLPWTLWLDDSRFERELNMSWLQAEEVVSLEGSFFGEKIDLSGAQIRGQLAMPKVTVKGKLDMDFALLGNLYMWKGTFEDIELRQAEIKGQAAMGGATVAGMLDMEALSTDRGLMMGQYEEKVATFSRVDLISATIGSDLSLAGGTFKTLDLTGATVKGELELLQDKKSVKWSDETESNEIQLNLRNTQVGALVDTLDSWPNRIELGGFTYRQLGGFKQENRDEPSERPADIFAEWLKRDKTFSFLSYQQLASVLRDAGKFSTADEVLFVGRDYERQQAKDGERVWLNVLQYGVGYGIGLYTFRVLYLVTFFVLFGWFVLVITGESQKYREKVGHIGFWFSLDYFLPVIRLWDAHFEKVDLSSGFARIYFYCHQILGYALVFFLIAALSGITEPAK